MARGHSFGIIFMSIATLIDVAIGTLLNTPMPTTKKELSKAELAECSRLKSIWESKKDELGLTQETLGALLGMSQGAVTQYLNGHTRIGDLTLFKFAYHIKFDPEDVRPKFYANHPELRPHDSEPLSQDDLSLLEKVRRISELDDDSANAIESLLSVLEKR